MYQDPDGEVADVPGDVHGVVAEALVEPGDQGGVGGVRPGDAAGQPLGERGGAGRRARRRPPRASSLSSVGDRAAARARARRTLPIRSTMPRPGGEALADR